MGSDLLLVLFLWHFWKLFVVTSWITFQIWGRKKLTFMILFTTQMLDIDLGAKKCSISYLWHLYSLGKNHAKKKDEMKWGYIVWRKLIFLCLSQFPFLRFPLNFCKDSADNSREFFLRRIAPWNFCKVFHVFYENDKHKMIL